MLRYKIEKLRDNLCTKIHSLYSDTSRAYHDLNHIAEMFSVIFERRKLYGEFEKDLEKWLNILEVCLCSIYHDAIYNINSKTNELDSFKLFKKHLGLIVNLSIKNLKQEQKLNTESFNEIRNQIISRAKKISKDVGSGIMATTHKSVNYPVNSVEAIVCDLDLLRLAAAPEKFDEYSQMIFKEYKVPDDKITEAMPHRIKALEHFYIRKRVYNSNIGIEYELAAQENLRRIGCNTLDSVT